MTGALPVTPEIPVVGPAAFNVQSVAAAVPPLSLMTAFESVRCAGMSSFVIVQVADWPTPRVTVDPVDWVAPVHTHADAV